VRARLARSGGAVALAAAAAAGVPAASLGVDPVLRADELRRANVQLAGKERTAAAELYGLETRLAHVRAELAGLRRQAADADRDLRSARARLRAARSTLGAAQRLLGERLRILYEQGETDPVAVLLGAQSLQDAFDGLDSLRLAAEQDRRIAEQAAGAKRDLAALSRTFELSRNELVRLREQTAARGRALARTGAERRGYLAELASRRALNGKQIAALEARVRAARAQTATLVASPPPDPGETAPAPPPVVGGPRTLTVAATGYSLQGTTATGLPVGWGVVAVDSSVIPLGASMTIPGYGEGVAADTGSSVRGAKIDIWFPTRAQALAWGTRTVTIAIRP
jgi:3D (Asp-Asp-Asp) domain-containing protein/peptidoglycan hydrolase CwlO-like protein